MVIILRAGLGNQGQVTNSFLPKESCQSGAPRPVIYCCPRGSILQSCGWFFKGFLKGQISACINAFKSQVIDHNYRPFPQIVRPQSLKKHNKHISFSKVWDIWWICLKSCLVIASSGTASMHRHNDLKFLLTCGLMYPRPRLDQPVSVWDINLFLFYS